MGPRRESKSPARRHLLASRQEVMEAWTMLVGVGGQEKWDSRPFLNVGWTGLLIDWMDVGRERGV